MPHTPASRSLIKFRAAHLRTSSTILAQSWENRTGFGQQGAPAQVLQERDRILAEHARRIAATIDFHQTRALQGQILDADGSVMVDLLAEFGVTLLTVDCALDVSTTNASNKIVEAKRKSEAELGMAAAESWLCFASAEYMDAIRAHQSFEPSVAGWSAATVLSADHRDGTLNIAGVKFLEVPNRAGQTYIAPGDAYLVPAGVPDLCITTFCPADYIDTVNMEGQPLYSRAQEMDFNRGITLETQANPISYCTRPKVVIRLAA